MRRLIPLVLAAAAVVALPLDATAQVRAFVGVSGGFARVSKEGPDAAAWRPSLGLRVGVGLGPALAVGVEGAVYGLDDEEPAISDFQNGEVVRAPEVLRTTVVTAFVQWGREGGLYVRPGVGLGGHAFAVYEVDANNDAVSAGTSSEGGIALSLAAGRAFPLGDRVSVGVEGVAVYSTGEDSTNPRRVFGLQLVPIFRF